MRIRERDGNFYLVRCAYSADARRGKETGLGCIPFWATPEDIDRWWKPRDGITLTPDERAQLERHLASANPPKDPLDEAAAWLKKSATELADLPLRDRQARIRQVRPQWTRLSALAGTKRGQVQDE
ncbi:hypothetical protein GCM10028796_32690 [Ramlibacter monticola]|uniref:Uncharacterized protein n=1 Tax=Ramlibacter monticola TaxID=1926872 RepID=A0A936Z371_9BURK|nr:hypothetical protein [Ramlibacter monticola]MBL0394160.1 hypothetical protein [Ramlibacter monticola]